MFTPISQIAFIRICSVELEQPGYTEMGLILQLFLASLAMLN